jgi:hypothetical protein
MQNSFIFCLQVRKITISDTNQIKDIFQQVGDEGRRIMSSRRKSVGSFAANYKASGENGFAMCRPAGPLEHQELSKP